MTARPFRVRPLLAATVVATLLATVASPAFATGDTATPNVVSAASTSPAPEPSPDASPSPEPSPDVSSSPASSPSASDTPSPAPVETRTAAADGATAAEGRTVLSAGSLRLGPGDFTGVVFAGRKKTATFDSFRLGVQDATTLLSGDPDKRAVTWSRADDVVVHVGDNQHDADAWSSPAFTADADEAAYVGDPPTRLTMGALLGIDRSLGNLFDPAGLTVRRSGSPLTLVAASGPTGGRFTAVNHIVTRDPDTFAESTRDIAVWDSAARGANAPAQTTSVDDARRQQWRFTAPGRYCLTVRQDLQTLRTPDASGFLAPADRSAQSTFTVVVGDTIDPRTVEACAQVPLGGSTEPETFVPTVLGVGHLDLRAVRNDTGSAIAFGVKQTAFVDSKDVVLAGTYGPATAGEGATPLDESVIGPAGTRYWYYEQGGFAGDHLWPGLSTEDWRLSDVGPTAQIDFTMTGVVGPTADARVLMFSDPSASGPTRPANVWFDSARLPMTRTETIGGHSHMNWAFTAEGRYCLGMTARMQVASGSWVSDDGILTVWVGDPAKASSVVPCERDATISMPHPTLAAVDVSPTTAAVSPSAGSTDLVTSLTTAGIDTVARLQETATSDARFLDAQDVIYRAMDVGDGSFRTGAAVGMRLDTTRIAPARLNRPITLSIGAPSGPGTVALRSTLAGVPDRLAPARGATSTELPGWTNDTAQWVFGARGVYCVPLTWTATPVGSSAPVSVTKVLTVAAGIDDTTGLTSCARGQQPGAPGGDGGGTAPSDPEAWNVPNGSTTASGAVILNDGHVDVASVLDGDRLVTRVKDSTSVAAEPVWRDPAQTVLQVGPAARTTVPSDAAYSFLGGAGSPIWQVTQTQQSELGLLWPGWSTEAIPLDRTQAGVRWSLDRVSGPGEFALFTSGQSFGSVDVKFASRDGITAADAFEIPKITHAHGTWAFTAEGAYCLGFTRSATLADGRAVSDVFTLAVSVGRTDVTKIDPARCFDDAGRPAVPDLLPVAHDRLTDATRGGIDTGGAADAVAGQLVALRVGASRAGQWVSVWAHGDAPRWLGWVRVDADGAARVRLPVDLGRGAQRLVVKTAGGDLIGWTPITVRDAPTVPTASPAAEDTATAPAVAAVCAAPTGTIIASGHVDWNAQVIDGRLRSFVGDDSSGTRVYRDPASTVLWLKPSSTVTIPASLSRVGTPGSTVWQIPQTQKPGVVWLGWSTELLHAGLVSGPVSWNLTGIDGPGQVRVFTTGAFGGVQDVVFDGAGTDTIPLGVHAHANWTFTQQGLYRLHFTQSATLANGQRSSADEVLTIAVGDADPRAGLPSAPGCAGTARATVSGDASLALVAPAAQLLPDVAGVAQGGNGRLGAGVGGAADAMVVESPTSSSPVPLLAGVLGGLLLLSAAGTGILWWRRGRS